jgi:hypothetical protein
MLVALYNVVKVESVPLNLANFRVNLLEPFDLGNERSDLWTIDGVHIDWLEQTGTSLTFEQVTGEPRRCLVMIPRVMQPNADRVDVDRYRFVGPCIDPGRESPGDWAPPPAAGPLALLAFGTGYTNRIDLYRNAIEALDGAGWRLTIAAIIGKACQMEVLVATLTIIAVVSLATGPAPAATDADQVRAVLDRMNSSYNQTDFDAFASHLCADMLRVPDFEAGWHESRASDGPTQIAVNSVDVTGDNAVANVRFEAANQVDAKTLDIDFLRDGTEWKACRYHSGQSV